MTKRILILAVAAFLLLGLCACRAAFSEGDTTSPSPSQTAPTTTAPSVTEPVVQYVEVWREGEVSQIPVQVITGQAGSYTIAIDPEYFTFLPQDGSDLFSYEAWGSEQPVYFRIHLYEGAYDPAAFLSQDTPASYEQTGSQSLTVAGFPATLVSMAGTGEAAGYCLHRFLLDCGVVRYCIEARFSMEMYEGLYAIMLALFDTFTVS